MLDRGQRAYGEAFEQHAAPEAISAFIKQAQRRRAEVDNEIRWLKELYWRRVAEKEAGQWP